MTLFCKQKNLLIILKMRDFFYNLVSKIRELELRASMPLVIGIYMLQSLKKQLKDSKQKAMMHKDLNKLSSLFGPDKEHGF